MGRVKAVVWTHQDLLDALTQRNRLWRLNNQMAKNDPDYAWTLYTARNANQWDAQAAAAEAKLAGIHGMSGAELYVIPIAGVLGIAGSALLLYVYLQIWREERVMMERSPVLYALQRMTTGIWAVLGLSTIGLLGYAYYEYKKDGAGFSGASKSRAPRSRPWRQVESRSAPRLPAKRSSSRRSKSGKDADWWAKLDKLDADLDRQIEEAETQLA